MAGAAEMGRRTGKDGERLGNGGLLVLHERCKEECNCKSESARITTLRVEILVGQLRQGG